MPTDNYILASDVQAVVAHAKEYADDADSRDRHGEGVRYDEIAERLTALIANATSQPEPDTTIPTCARCGWAVKICTCKPTEPQVPLAVVLKLKADLDNEYHRLKAGTAAWRLKKLAMWAWDAFDDALLPYRPAPDAAKPVCATCGDTREIGDEDVMAMSHDCPACATEPQGPVTMEQRAAWFNSLSYLKESNDHDLDAFELARALYGYYDDTIRTWLAAKVDEGGGE